MMSVKSVWKRSMSESQKNNPLHAKTLEQVVKSLTEYYGWKKLGQRINIRCFTHNPSLKSSLTFLRRTPWAREQVEALYIETFSQHEIDENN